MYEYSYMYIYIYIYIHVYIYIFIYTNIYIYIHKCRYIHKYLYMCVYTYTNCTSCHMFMSHGARMWRIRACEIHCNTLQHTATHCNTLQHIDILQHTTTHCNTRLNIYRANTRLCPSDNYDCQKFQQVFTGVPVHIKHVLTEVPQILNKFS